MEITMFLRKNNFTKLTLQALFTVSISLVSASAPIMPMHAMEKPIDICGTCGQIKQTLSLSNFAYFSIRAHRCRDCKSILKDNIEAGRITSNLAVANAPAPQETQSDQLSILVTEPTDVEKGNTATNGSSMSNTNTIAPVDSIAIDIAKEHCIACAQPLDNGTKPHIYSCKHAIHKDCFTRNNNQLKDCFTCKTTGKTAQQEKSGWGWFSWGKSSSSKPETPQQQLDQLEQTNINLSKRYKELQCSFQFLNQQLAETNEENAQLLAQTKKQLEERIAVLNVNLNVTKRQLENSIANLQANKEILQLKALLAYQQNLAFVERGSLLAGGAAALIAHNKNYSATKAALIGLGTTLTSYNLLKLFVSKPQE